VALPRRAGRAAAARRCRRDRERRSDPLGLTRRARMGAAGDGAGGRARGGASPVALAREPEPGAAVGNDRRASSGRSSANNGRRARESRGGRAARADRGERQPAPWDRRAASGERGERTARADRGTRQPAPWDRRAASGEPRRGNGSGGCHFSGYSGYKCYCPGQRLFSPRALRVRRCSKATGIVPLTCPVTASRALRVCERPRLCP
jgi:hypothetical protein